MTFYVVIMQDGFVKQDGKNERVKCVTEEALPTYKSAAYIRFCGSFFLFAQY